MRRVIIRSESGQFFIVDSRILNHIDESPREACEFVIPNFVALNDSGEFDFVVWDTAASS